MLWSKFNLGAPSQEEYGAYFSWGETQPKDIYTEDTYSYYDQYIGDDISGTKYDAATAILGGGWRMPTKTELQELRDKCSWKWTKENGVKGYVVTGNNGNTIFIPVAGWAYSTIIVIAGDSFGTRSWTYTLYEYNEECAYSQEYDNKGIILKTNRFYGVPIRPVTSK